MSETQAEVSQDKEVEIVTTSTDEKSSIPLVKITVPRNKPDTTPARKGDEFEIPALRSDFVIALITREISDRRILIKQIKVSGTTEIFRWKRDFYGTENGYYYIDLRQAFLYGQHPYLLFDVKIVEPFTIKATNETVQMHKPLTVTGEVHWSPDVERILLTKAYAQVIKETVKKGGLGILMTVLFFVAGAVAGFCLGQVIRVAGASMITLGSQPQPQGSVVTTTVSITQAVTTILEQTTTHSVVTVTPINVPDITFYGVMFFFAILVMISSYIIRKRRKVKSE